MAYKSDTFKRAYGARIIKPYLATSGSQASSSLTSPKDKKGNLRSTRVCSVAVGTNKHRSCRPTVQLCPINVGQGDSILLKLQYEQGMLHPMIENFLL